MRVAPASCSRGGLADLVADDTTEQNLVRFGQGFGSVTDIQIGPNGVVYVTSIGNGTVYRLPGAVGHGDAAGGIAGGGVGAAASYADQAVSGTSRSSTRRFCWRPSGVSLPAIGKRSPNPSVIRRCGTTCCDRK